MAGETRALARFAADLTHEQIPLHVRSLAIDILVDQLGCQIGCSDLPWATQVRDACRNTGGTPEATVVRYGDRLPAGSAAFINSTFGHAFEYGDGNPLILGHPGAELVPSLLAMAERGHISGREFVTAFIAAHEVRGRIGWALAPDMMEHGGPHYSTTCGPFGVAVGAARILALGADGIANALGIAGGYAGGLMQYTHGGGSMKRIYPAIAASSGIQAARLAQAGLTGPEEILEGKRGVLKIYSATPRPDRLVAGFGEKWTIEFARFKPYSCCGGIHAAIDGLKKVITAHSLKANDIATIEVNLALGYHDHVAITSPHDLLGMQFSTSYSLALTVLKGQNTPREYTMDALADPEIRAFASKVQVRGDAELSKLVEGRQPARVKLRTVSGDVFEELTMYAKGSPGLPLSRAEIDSKFNSQVVGILGEARSEELLHVLRNIDALDDIAKLLPMLVVESA